MFTSTMVTIVGIALGSIATLIILVCMLKGLFRPVLRSGMQLLVALICIPIALLLAKIVGGALLDTALGFVDVPIIDAVLKEIPSASEAAGGLIQIVVAPFLFVVFYLILWLLIGAIVGVVIRMLEKGKSKVARYRNPWIGLFVGAVCSMVLVVVFFVPLSGLTGVADDAMESGILKLEDKDGDRLIDISRQDRENLEAILNTPTLRITRSLGGKALFRSLTTTKFAGTKLSLTGELDNVCELAVVASPLLNTPLAELDDDDVRAIEQQIPRVFENSTLLRVLGAEALSGASSAWLKGDEFITIEKPETEGMVAIVVDSVLEIFVDTTPETIVEDIRSLAPAFSAAIAVTKLQAGADIEDIVDALAEAAASPEIKALLLNAGVRILAEELNLYENKEAIHDAYATSLAELSQKNLTKEELVEQISALNDRFVIDMTEQDIQALAEAMIDIPFEDILSGTPSAALPTDGVIVMQPCLSTQPPVFEFLAKTSPLQEWLNKLLESPAVQAETLGWLAESEEIPSALVTTEDLITVADQDALEALGKEEIAELIVVAAQLVVSEEKPSITDVLTTVGESLSGVTSSEKGQELVTTLVTGVMQSDKVCETLGITPSQATGLAESLKESGSLDNLSQTAADVTKLMNIIDQLQKGGASAVDKLNAEELHSLISTINDSTAELLRTMCSADMLAKMGVPSQYTVGVSHLSRDLLEGLIKARKNWSAEAYQREADALYQILKLAIGAKSSTGNTFEERVGMSAEELIETVQASELMLDVLPESINELYDQTPDALGLTQKISEKDRNHLKNKIEEYKDSANPRGDELLDALGRLLG